MGKGTDAQKVTTPIFVASYPNVFKARMNDMSKKEEYSVTALFPTGTNFDSMKAAAKAACIDKWGPDAAKWPKPIRMPFRDQGDRAKVSEATGQKVLPAGYKEGNVYMNFKTYQKPGLINAKKEHIIDETEFYAGCSARAIVWAQAYDTAGNRGVSFYLRHIQKVAEGEPLSGRTKPEDEFAPIEGVVDTASSDLSADALFS